MRVSRRSRLDANKQARSRLRSLFSTSVYSFLRTIHAVNETTMKYINIVITVIADIIVINFTLRYITVIAIVNVTTNI